jgi:hypothetical protein
MEWAVDPAVPCFPRDASLLGCSAGFGAFLQAQSWHKLVWACLAAVPGCFWLFLAVPGCCSNLFLSPLQCQIEQQHSTHNTINAGRFLACMDFYFGRRLGPHRTSCTCR